MAAGRPVILAARGESARIVTEAGGGIAVAPEDPQELADAIHELRRDPAATERLAGNARAAVRPLLRSEQAAFIYWPMSFMRRSACARASLLLGT